MYRQNYYVERASEFCDMKEIFLFWWNFFFSKYLKHFRVSLFPIFKKGHMKENKATI